MNEYPAPDGVDQEIWTGIVEHFGYGGFCRETRSAFGAWIRQQDNRPGDRPRLIDRLDEALEAKLFTPEAMGPLFNFAYTDPTWLPDDLAELRQAVQVELDRADDPPAVEQQTLPTTTRQGRTAQISWRARPAR